MGWNIFFYIVGSAVGALITWQEINPKKIISETYKKASEDLGDYEKWFTNGWDAAFATIKQLAEAYKPKGGNSEERKTELP